MSDLRAWIDEVGDDTDRALAALHDDNGVGRCLVCADAGTFSFDEVGTSLLSPAAHPCQTVRLVAGRHRDQPGFRPGWEPDPVELPR